VDVPTGTGRYAPTKQPGVYVNGAMQWIEWAYFKNVDRVARRGLILAGGGTHYDWWVIERPVAWDEIVEIRDMEDDTILDKE
jgi:hypothetical protein